MMVGRSLSICQRIIKKKKTNFQINVVLGMINSFIGIGACSPWVGWVMANALLHFGWVAVLTFCQTYQVVCLGMTTNERMNRGRYRHFQAHGGKSPFSRGPIKNIADFLECGCFGMVKPVNIDWMNYYEMNARNIEHEPLLNGPQADEGFHII